MVIFFYIFKLAERSAQKIIRTSVASSSKSAARNTSVYNPLESIKKKKVGVFRLALA